MIQVFQEADDIAPYPWVIYLCSRIRMLYEINHHTWMEESGIGW